MTAFFKNLPNIYVGVEGADEIIGYKKVKNIFRRVIVSEAIEKYSTQFDSFYIPDGMRPDLLAAQVYGDSELDWVILISNNIIDVYEDWPKDEYTLREYALKKYSNIDAIHHWETNEVKDGDVVHVKKGIEVNETYRAVLGGNTLSKAQSVYSVTCFEHETYLNEKKRLIALPNATLLEFFEDNFEELCDYEWSREIDEKGNKRTNNSFASRFLDRANFRRSAPTTVSRTGATSGANVTYDNGPSSTTATAGVVSKT